MTILILKLAVAPALMGAATLGARRWGPRGGGLVSAFPAIVGPVLLIGAVEHGAGFAAREADGALLGLVALSAFVLAYARAARHAGWRISLLAGWAAAGLVAPAVQGVHAGLALALAAAAASLTVARIGVAGTSPRRGLPAAPRWDLPLRMAMTALLVVTLTAAAGRLGAVAGGVLTALPALASVLAAFTHHRYGSGAATALLRGMVDGMAGYVVFCALVGALAVPAGPAAAFVAATVAAVAAQALMLRPQASAGYARSRSRRARCAELRAAVPTAVVVASGDGDRSR